MPCFYNELDPYAAKWLRSLIDAGELPGGTVDARDIRYIEPRDVAEVEQCHWFAGIGGWAYALQLAIWPTTRPVWTASCPCQPFSQAGKRKGTADERHLWPILYRLIRERRPATIFGEQVASNDGLEWFAGVRADLEAIGYAVGCADLPAACVASPHKRQRLFFVADAGHNMQPGAGHGRAGKLEETERTQSGVNTKQNCLDGNLAHTDGRQSSNGDLQRSREHGQQPQDSGAGGMGDTNDPRLQERAGDGQIQCQTGLSSARQALELSGAWGNFDIIPCRDGKARRVESGSFPLAHGVPNRVGRLRGYGNAIVPQVAAAFIKAYLETEASVNQAVNPHKAAIGEAS